MSDEQANNDNGNNDRVENVEGMVTCITHWLPIITFCPVNNLPDLIYIKLYFKGFNELYDVRRRLKNVFAFKTIFMEQIAINALDLFSNALKVEVTLITGRHKVTLTKKGYSNELF